MTGWEGIYCGPAPNPAELLSRWNFDPIALAAIALAFLWAGRDRYGVAALAVLAIAFVSPLCALSSALFSARVVHHVLLVAVAAPLLALARPAPAPAGAALPFLTATAALWFWHLPAAYDAALGHKGLYLLMQLSLLAPACWLWRAAFSRPGGSAAVWVLFAYIAMGLLGALLALAPAPLYGTHAVAPFLWGLTPLEDQQLGGLIMWVPAGLAYAVWGALIGRRAWRKAGEAA